MRYYFCLIFFIYFGIGMNGQEDSTTLAISRFDKVPSNIKVHKTIIDNKNVIWLCTNDGLLETTGDGGKLFSYLKGNSIVDFVKDKSEQKWAASVNTIIQYKYRKKLRTSKT
ncbi:MAG: hypothetical protein IPG79_05885 [Saprospiraceae bacterium]|nr:hypothetical protein [Saprospiraceae bacterium]